MINKEVKLNKIQQEVWIRKEVLSKKDSDTPYTVYPKKMKWFYDDEFVKVKITSVEENAG